LIYTSAGWCDIDRGGSSWEGVKGSACHTRTQTCTHDSTYATAAYILYRCERTHTHIWDTCFSVIGATRAQAYENSWPRRTLAKAAGRAGLWPFPYADAHDFAPRARVWENNCRRATAAVVRGGLQQSIAAHAAHSPSQSRSSCASAVHRSMYYYYFNICFPFLKKEHTRVYTYACVMHNDRANFGDGVVIFFLGVSCRFIRHIPARPSAIIIIVITAKITAVLRNL